MASPNAGDGQFAGPVPLGGRGPVPAVPQGYQPPPAGWPGQFVPQNQYAPNPFAVATPTAAPPTGHRMLPTIIELVHSFKRRWFLSLLVGSILGAVAAAAIWMAMPSGKHQAQAIIQLKAEISGVMGKSFRLDPDAFDNFVNQEQKLLGTKTFLLKVAQDPAVAKLPVIADSDDKARTMKDMLSIKRDPSEILTVTMTGDDKDQLNVLLKQYANIYVNGARADETLERSKQIDNYAREIKKLEGQVNNYREKLKDNQDKAAPDFLLSLWKRDLDAINKRNRDQKEQIQLAKAEVEQLKEAEKTGTAIVERRDIEAAIDDSPAFRAKLDELRPQILVLEKKLEGFVSGSDIYKSTKEKIDKLQRELSDYRNTLTEQVEADLKNRSLSNFGADIRKKNASIVFLERTLKEGTQEEERLKSQIEKAASGGVGLLDEKTLIEPLIQQITAYRLEMWLLEAQDGISDENKKSRYVLLEDAVVYENYNLKTKMAFAIIAGIGILLATMVVIAYLEWRNRRVDGVAQVVEELGMRVIGTIPAFPSRAQLRNGEASANQNWRFILNESVNSTRTMLLHTARTQQMQVILVTSAMQGEGKTSLSSQLATSMATAGLRTLILDCDLRNPSMQKLFDIPVVPGCAEILLQEIDISDAVQATSVPNLWIIPAGQCNHRVIAALAQGHPLENLFNRLRGQFDIIVVDSCPILPVADTLLVAQHVDGVVFSILQDVSQLPKVQDASERLVQLNIPMVGAVVNGIKPDIQAYGYNYVKQLPA